MAIIDTTELTLFGFDLTRAFAWVRLGVKQLLWDRNSTVKYWFYPQVKLSDTTRDGGVLASLGRIADDASCSAIVLSSDHVLTRVMRLPIASELFLDEVVMLDLASHSPFAEQDTVCGWSVELRDGNELVVRWVLAARTAVNDLLLEAGFDPLNEISALPEVWASTGESEPVRLQGFGEQKRDWLYTAVLRKLTIKALGVYVLLLAVLAQAPIYSALSTAKLDQKLAEVTENAKGVSRVRERLGEQRELLDVAQIFLASRGPMRPRMHDIAQITPDSVYLQRMTFKGDDATVTGLGGNAADYLAILAESDRYAKLEASSAFTRDRRTGLEQFTIDIKFEDANDEI